MHIAYRTLPNFMVGFEHLTKHHLDMPNRASAPAEDILQDLEYALCTAAFPLDRTQCDAHSYPVNQSLLVQHSTKSTSAVM